MARIAIIGGGAFGSAMACVVRRSGHEVVLWAFEREVVESINRELANPVYLKGIPLARGIRATGEVAEAVRGADVVVMAPPAQHMRRLAAEVAPHVRPQTPIVSCSKGIELGSGALMPEVIAAQIPDGVPCVLSGPSFAAEIARGLPCGVVLACADWSVAEFAAEGIANPDFCVHLSADVPGTAIAGAMKNVVAIASGVVHGRGLGENARATVVTLGLAESEHLALAKGGRSATFAGLAGAGDFMLTAHSLQSRNTSLGVALGEGRTLQEALHGRVQVTEGVATVRAVVQLAHQLGVRMPVAQTLARLIEGRVDIDGAITEFMHHLPPLVRTGAVRAEAALPA